MTHSQAKTLHLTRLVHNSIIKSKTFILLSSRRKNRQFIVVQHIRTNQSTQYNVRAFDLFTPM